MHDRFVFPVNFFSAMQRYGNLFSVLTFPQVYFADQSRRCVQRYPDYQLLSVDEGIRDSFITKIYDGNQIFHPRYDDFSESAFCCGGLYLTKTTIWKLIRQDESLFHCEWEDVLFGLESQRMGIPHRVNPYACFESTAPHPLLLTRINIMEPEGKQERSFQHISSFHNIKAANGASDYLPILSSSKRGYCEKLVGCFNSMSMVDAGRRIGINDFTGASKLSEIWGIVSRYLGGLPVNNRDEIFQIISLLSHMVYNYPACILQAWTWDEECRLSGMNEPAHALVAAIRTAFVEGGLKLVVSLTLKRIARTLVCLCSCGATALPPKPFLDIIDYFKEIERYYPVIFQDEFSPDNRSSSEPGKTVDIHELLDEQAYWKTIFLKHGEEVLPLISSEGRGIRS
jgi:hypothetical protein